MPDYTLAIGTHDPHGFSAAGDADAIRYTVGYIEARHASELADKPEEVVTLMGADGLVTRPSERIDEFVERLPGEHPGIDPRTFRPGDSNAPDCNGD